MVVSYRKESKIVKGLIPMVRKHILYLSEKFTKDDQSFMNAKIYLMTEIVGSHPNILKIIGAVDDQARKFKLYINRLPNVILVFKLHGPIVTNVDLHRNCIWFVQVYVSV